MSERDKKIINTFERTLPHLSEIEKERLLAFGEGMVFKAEMQNKEKEVMNKEA